MTSLSVLKAQAINAVRKSLGRFETQHSRYRGWLKSVDGSVKVSGRPGYVYVQRRDTTGAQTEEIRMPDTNVPAISGYPVVVGRTSVYRTEDVIIGRDTDTVEEWLYDYVMQAHASQHAQGGFDTLWVQGRVIIPLRVSAQSTPNLTVNIEPGVYPTLTGNTWYDGATDYNMSAYIPDSGQRWVIIGINQNTDLVQCVTGTPIPRSRTLEWSDLPEIPSDLVTLAAIIMHLGQTAIAEDEIFELRAFAGWAGTLAVQEYGIEVLDTATALNFTGDGVSVSVDGTTAIIHIPGAPDLTVQDDGVLVVDGATILNFTGNGVEVTADGLTAIINIPGGGGTVPNPVAQGDMLAASAAPAWVLHTIGTAHQIQKVNAGGTDPIWDGFDWDEIAAAVGADMVHYHSSAAEGGDAIMPDTVTIGSLNIPNQDGVLAQIETADPAAQAGESRLYPKADGTQTKYYFMDDTGGVYEIQGIAKDLTVTVKAAGGDFTTIQDAVDWFKSWIVQGACVIDCDAATYDELVDFASLLIAPGATLTLEGDTRLLAGVSYVVGSISNQNSIANGGTFNAANRCTLTVDAAGDTITVAGGTGNPDFDADGWIPGDKVIIFGDDDNFYGRVIDTVLNNVIDITVALPGGAFPGGGGAMADGSAIGLQPDREIIPTAVGSCITVSGVVSGVVVDGWYLSTAFDGSGTENGVSVSAGGKLDLFNILTYVEDTGVAVAGRYGAVEGLDGACSFFGGSRGASAAGTAMFKGTYATSVGPTQYGFYATNLAWVGATRAIVGRAGSRGYFASTQGLVFANAACDRSSAQPYYANTFAGIYAGLTDANNTVPGVGNYNPAPGAVPGYGNGNGDANIYAS